MLWHIEWSKYTANCPKCHKNREWLMIISDVRASDKILWFQCPCDLRWTNHILPLRQTLPKRFRLAWNDICLLTSTKSLLLLHLHLRHDLPRLRCWTYWKPCAPAHINFSCSSVASILFQRTAHSLQEWPHQMSPLPTRTCTEIALA